MSLFSHLEPPHFTLQVTAVCALQRLDMDVPGVATTSLQRHVCILLPQLEITDKLKSEVRTSALFCNNHLQLTSTQYVP